MKACFQAIGIEKGEEGEGKENSGKAMEGRGSDDDTIFSIDVKI